MNHPDPGGASFPPPKRPRIEVKHRTPSIPSSEIEITWEIEDVDQLLLCQTRTEDPDVYWRRSLPIKVYFHDTVRCSSESLEAEGDRMAKKLEFAIKIDVKKQPGAGGQRKTGCYLEALDSTKSEPFQLKGLFIQVLLPDGSNKKSKLDPDLGWKRLTNNCLGWRNFLSENLDFSECGLHSVGDGGLILRARAEIMREGWHPIQCCPRKTQHRIDLVGEEVTTSSILRNVYSSMLESSEFSDVSLVCQDGQSFKCHKAVLSAWSTVFRAMFTHSDMMEGQTRTVSIKDIKPHTVKVLLNCMYGGYFHCEPADQLDVLAAADKYNIQSVKNQYLKTLIDKLQNSPCDVPEVVAFTDLHADLKCLRFAAIQALSAQKDEIMSSEGWSLLCETAPQAALKAITDARQFEKHNVSQVNCECWK
mmetsp:Transcript_29421/g.46356  ORF Transcript_29421/g.46356 Transcript_29421/m.46356 type:complete len:419 (+) Transcript_29421:50-1306(+)